MERKPVHIPNAQPAIKPEEAGSLKALREHIEVALKTPENDLARALLKDKKVLPQTIAEAIALFCEEFERKPPKIQTPTREALATALTALVHSVHNELISRAGAGHVDLPDYREPEDRFHSAKGDTGMSRKTEKEMALADWKATDGQTANITRRVRSLLRRQCGWVGIDSAIGRRRLSPAYSTVAQAFNAIRERYLSAYRSRRMSEKKAEADLYENYIAQDIVYLNPKYSRLERPFIYTDLSPEAARDLKMEYERLTTLREQSVGVGYVLARWDVRSGNKKRAPVQNILDIIVQVRQEEIERRCKGTSLTPEQVAREVDEEYIEIGVTRAGRSVYKIQLCAIPAIDAKVQVLLPDRKPRELQRNSNSQWQPSTGR